MPTQSPVLHNPIGQVTFPDKYFFAHHNMAQYDGRRVVVTNKAFPETLDLLRKRFDVVANVRVDPWSRDELIKHCRHAFAMLAFMSDSVDDNLLSQCSSLKIIACALKGHDNFDALACTRRGVWLTVVPDLLTNPTAELCVGLMLGLSRHIQQADRYVRAGRFNGWLPEFYGSSIDGSVVGLLGGGSIGCAIARKLSGFSCRVIIYDKSPNRSLPRNASWATFEEVVENSDFLVLALPLTDTTLHIVNAPLIERIKNTCLLINPARGSLVDEAAVAAALESERLGGYAADVFEFEDKARADRPQCIAPRLLAMEDRTLFTAHIGSAVTEVRKEIEREAAKSILDMANGEGPRGAVNNPLTLVS